MAGTPEGARKAVIVTKAKHGDDFYAKIGSKGGTETHKRGKIVGFMGDPERARKYGAIGGRNSKPYSKNPRVKP